MSVDKQPFKPAVSVLLLLLVAPLAVAAETTITAPEKGSFHDPGSDLTIEWQAVQDHAEEDTLKYTLVSVRDENVTIHEQQIDQNTDVAKGKSASTTHTVSTSDLDNLTPGTWTITVEDTWSQERGEAVGRDTATIRTEKEREETVEEQTEPAEDSTATDTPHSDTSSEKVNNKDSLAPDTDSLTTTFTWLNTALILLLLLLFMWRELTR
jgi:hypothetical protein